MRRYQDPYVVAETDGRLGDYVTSYEFENDGTLVHFFQAAPGRYRVFIIKSPGVPVAQAQAVVPQAVRQFEREQGLAVGSVEQRW